jgi:O-antigen/teichoic acid export membrane protein
LFFLARVQADVTASPQVSSEVLLSIRNAFKLGGSLAVTWGISLCILLFLPRWLGPEAFGSVSAADAFAATCFVALSLGVDVYIRKEIPIHPEHANEFFGALMVFRLAMAAFILGGFACFMWLMGVEPLAMRVTLLFGVAQTFSAMKESLAALLHARGTVGGLALNNIAGKVLWGGGVLAAVFLWEPPLLEGVALALLGAKLLESLGAWWLARKHLGLCLTRFRTGALKGVLLSCLPLYLNQVFHTVYNKADIPLLSFLVGNQEAGWYGEAAKWANIALLMTPFLGWVVVPLFARARHQRSPEEFNQVLRRMLELVLTVAVPLCLFIALGAEVLVLKTAGPEFSEAVGAMRLRAPIYAFMYISIISATALIMEGRAWTVTWISAAGLVFNLGLNVLFLRAAVDWLGPGGGGVGAAGIQLLTEGGVMLAMFATLGRRCFDKRSTGVLLKTGLVCAGVVGLHQGLLDWNVLYRLAVEVVAYVVLAVWLGAVHLREAHDFVRMAFKKKQAG